jgi:hypothetical protein
VEADILARNSNGESVLVAEIKNRQNLSRGVATALRRNLGAHNLLPHSAYFLLASQDVGYLWTPSKSLTPQTPPTVEFPMVGVIARYFPNVGPNDRLREAELEMLLLQWFQDLAGPAPNIQAEPEATLARTGFLDAIQGATILANVKT